MTSALWIVPDDFPTDLSAYAGFIYSITDILTGKSYIGKKAFLLKRGKKLVPSRWQSYFGSCEPLLMAIREHGKERFERRILSVHRTAFLLSYEEVAEQIRRDVLRATLPNGERAFWNNCVAGKWYARHFTRWASPNTI